VLALRNAVHPSWPLWRVEVADGTFKSTELSALRVVDNRQVMLRRCHFILVEHDATQQPDVDVIMKNCRFVGSG
jgi:hypothetical protein